MTHFAGKMVRVIVLCAITVMLLAGFAVAAEAEQAVAVGATTGSSLRMRAKASTSSSIITNLDKGVAVAVLDKSIDGWYKVSYDGNSGFVSADYLILDKDNVFETYGRVNGDVVNVRAAANTDSEIVTSVYRGTVVTVNGFENGWYKITCEYGTQGFIRSDFLDLTADSKPVTVTAAEAAEASASGTAIMDLAMQHKGTRYVWGGSAPGGFDCSGYTMYVYKQFGYSLPHTASGQWKSGIGTKVTSIGALQPGDLVFFNDPSRNAGKACSHVGIYIGNGQHIHASSAKNGVVISDLTSGYYNRYFIGGIHV